MSTSSGGMSWGTTVIIFLLCLILWGFADFYGDYKKNNMSEQEKAELVLNHKSQVVIKEQQANDEQRLLASSFKDVKSEEKITWVLVQLLNSVFAQIALIFVVVAGGGWWYIRK